MNVKITCANVSVPLDWTDEISNDINLFIWKISSPLGNATKQLWILQGGPGKVSLQITTKMLGDSGGEMIQTAPQFYEGLGLDYDLYFPDHRGTGLSSYIVSYYFISC